MAYLPQGTLTDTPIDCAELRGRKLQRLVGRHALLAVWHEQQHEVKSRDGEKIEQAKQVKEESVRCQGSERCHCLRRHNGDGNRNECGCESPLHWWPLGGFQLPEAQVQDEDSSSVHERLKGIAETPGRPLERRQLLKQQRNQ